MRKYIWPLLAVLLLLAGCTAQPPDPTPTPTPIPVLEETPTPTATPTPTPTATPEPTTVGIEVDIGGGEHTFWVVLAKEEEGTQVNIYRNRGDSEPVQSFVEEEGFVDLVLAELTAEDVDFDGCMDFHFYTSFGCSIVSYSSYYVWDPEEQCFRPDPYGLNELSTVEFSPEWKQVHSLSRGPMGTMVVSYQYENGALVEVGESFYPEEDSTEKAYTAHWITVDDEHTFWVKLMNTECWGSFEINIYREKGDTQPFQTLEGSCETDFQYLRWNIEDMDFDGYTDFGVLYGEAPNGHASFSYYIWDEKSSKFVPDPYGLNELISVDTPEMLSEEKAIRTYLRWGAGSVGDICFYRYLEEGFTCVRTMSWNWHEDGVSFLVENYENGELRTVYKEMCSHESLNGYLWSKEFSKWQDLSYHGE